MSACTCCPPDRLEDQLKSLQELPGKSRKVSLFNWVTVLLVTGWVGIVTLALQLAAEKEASMPSLESFISSLL